jgi:hypothetical protein
MARNQIRTLPKFSLTLLGLLLQAILQVRVRSQASASQRIELPMIRLLLLVLLVLGLPVLKAQGTLDCGKYATGSTQQGPACHRVGILPWFIGIPGQWETELRLGAGGDTVKFGYVSSLSLTYYDANLLLEDSQWGSKAFESLSGLDLPRYGSHWTRILGACHALAGQCPPEGATGSMIVTADAPSAAALVVDIGLNSRTRARRFHDSQTYSGRCDSNYPLGRVVGKPSK